MSKIPTFCTQAIFLQVVVVDLFRGGSAVIHLSLTTFCGGFCKCFFTFFLVFFEVFVIHLFRGGFCKSLSTFSRQPPLSSRCLMLSTFFVVAFASFCCPHYFVMFFQVRVQVCVGFCKFSLSFFVVQTAATEQPMPDAVKALFGAH